MTDSFAHESLPGVTTAEKWIELFNDEVRYPEEVRRPKKPELEQSQAEINSIDGYFEPSLAGPSSAGASHENADVAMSNAEPEETSSTVPSEGNEGPSVP